jgi:hypothetical protein
MRALVLEEVERAAPVRQPAHDHPVATDHLLAVDAQVLPLLERPARHHQAPGDQRRGVPRPTVLDRQLRQVDLVTLPHHLLAGRGAHLLGRHVEHLLQHRQLVPGVLQALGRLGLLEVGEQLADFAQRRAPVAVGDVLAHAHRHPLRGAEEVGEHGDGLRHALGHRLLEQQGRPAGAQHTVGDLGHLEVGVDRGLDAAELATGFELGEEIAEVGVVHSAWDSMRHCCGRNCFTSGQKKAPLPDRMRGSWFALRSAGAPRKAQFGRFPTRNSNFREAGALSG